MSDDAGSVVGLDGCRDGWIAAVLEPRGLRVEFLDDLAGVRELADRVVGVAVDMPVVLVARGRREADVLARRALGARASTLFLAPVGAALAASSFDEANALNRVHGGFGLSRQAYGLFAKMRDVAAWSAPENTPVWEVHPEIAFLDATGRDRLAPKKTWAGAVERASVLRALGLFPDAVSPTAAACAGVDDVLDAVILAWAARNLANGRGASMPGGVDPRSPVRHPVLWRTFPASLGERR
jgi:predicted RNase H-like nuclease